MDTIKENDFVVINHPYHDTLSTGKATVYRVTGVLKGNCYCIEINTTRYIAQYSVHAREIIKITEEEYPELFI